MKKIILIMLLITSSNAKWESTHLKDGALVLFNTETGQAFFEYMNNLTPLKYSIGLDFKEDVNGKTIVIPIFPTEVLPYDPKKVGSK